jgi:hypothetical protein
MGKCRDEVRLPLAPLGEANKAKLTAIMKEYDLIAQGTCPETCFIESKDNCSPLSGR